MPIDCYQILGCQSDSSHGEIRKAYHKLAARYHPDLNPGNKAAEELFKLINLAYKEASGNEKATSLTSFWDSLSDRKGRWERTKQLIIEILQEQYPEYISINTIRNIIVNYINEKKLHSWEYNVRYYDLQNYLHVLVFAQDKENQVEYKRYKGYRFKPNDAQEMMKAHANKGPKKFKFTKPTVDRKKKERQKIIRELRRKRRVDEERLMKRILKKVNIQKREKANENSRSRNR